MHELPGEDSRREEMLGYPTRDDPVHRAMRASTAGTLGGGRDAPAIVDVDSIVYPDGREVARDCEGPICRTRCSAAAEEAGLAMRCTGIVGFHDFPEPPGPDRIRLARQD